MRVKAALIVFGAWESSKSSSVNSASSAEASAGGRSKIRLQAVFARPLMAMEPRLTWDRSGHAPNILAPSQMAARHRQMGPRRSLAPVLLRKDGDERAAGVKETGSHSSHLLISRK